MALKVEAKGGKGGNQWDDKFDYEGVTKIHVRGGIEGIQFIKFEYVKAGKTIDGRPIHGTSGRGLTQTFEINHSAKEYLLSVEGYYDESTGVIQSLRFITNTKTSDLMGFNDGTKFVLGASRKKIIGFHGFAEKNLNSLGAYIIKIPSTKSAIQGNRSSGTGFDDGGDFDGIRKLYIRKDVHAVRHLKIDYDKAGQVETRERGTTSNTQEYQFTVNYPSEYITSVEGYYAHAQAYNCVVLMSLTFKTSKGRTSETIGKRAGTKFVLESNGDAIVGFHGRSGSCVDGLGAYFAPPPSSSAIPEKLLGQGGDAGESWDDGAFQNVKKIYVGQGDVGIASVKFEYENDSSEVVVGQERGTKTLLGYEEFELDYPSEYITSVEGCHDRVMGAETGVITMLRFKTNKRTSPPFGLESASSFVIQKEGHKIVGFHGKASTLIHQIGVHVLPIA